MSWRSPADRPPPPGPSSGSQAAEPLHQLARPDLPNGVPDRGVVGAGAQVGHVLAHAAGEDVGLLRNQRERATKAGTVELGERNAFQADTPRPWLE